MPILMTSQGQLHRQPLQLGEWLNQLGFRLAIGDGDDRALLDEETRNTQPPGARAETHDGDPFSLI